MKTLRMRLAGIDFRCEANNSRSRFVLAMAMSIGVAAISIPAMSQTFNTLHEFNGSDGNIPAAGVVHDPAGLVYGTTYYGGLGSGVVFQVDTSGNFKVLHQFTNEADGGSPAGDLIRDSAGNLYGTTTTGGDPVCGCGVVFKMDHTGKETVLYSFKGGQDGTFPGARLFRDSAGNLYGTTFQGGLGNGIVFKLDKTGRETVLYRFRGGSDGANPSGGVIRDSAGNLYGTTSGGGHLNGTVFKIDAKGKESILYRFRGGADGSSPVGGVVRDSAGNLYGVTNAGGDSNCNDDNTGACGTVFKIDASGTETVLHSFTGAFNAGSDGAYPEAGLVMDSAGNLYGTTNRGGNVDAGTVFEVSAAGIESVVINMDGFPEADLFLDRNGTFYGVTAVGGIDFCGTVFDFTL